MDESLTIRLSSLEHYVYCPRQCALIDVEGQWEDNRHIVKGHRVHTRADSGDTTQSAGKTTLRSIPLWSERHRLVGRADVIEISDAGLTPVEYKAGTRHGDAADVQLCAQAICLEEMFDTTIERGYLWLGASRRRVAVELDDVLRSRTVDVIDSIRSMLVSAQMPVAPADRRCDECQLLHRCLPTLVADPDRVDRLAQSLWSGVDP